MAVTRKHSLFIAAALLAAGGIVLALRRPPIPVEVGRVARGRLRVTLEEEGKTRVRDRFRISTPAAGRLQRVALEEGDAVAERSVLAHLEALPLDERSRAEARARLQAAEAAHRAAEARAKQAREAFVQAQRTHSRTDELARQGLRSPEEREQAELSESTRGRELDVARHAARAAAFEAEAARAVLLADEPARKGEMASSVIAVRSPIAGRILRVFEESERSLPAGSPILEVGDPTRLEVVLDLLSTDAVRVRTGAEMSVDGGEGRILRGHVRSVEPSAFTKISALGVEEQRVNVIGDLDEASGRLGDGYRVEAEITIWDGKDVLIVPTSALFRTGDRWSAFAVVDGRASRRIVEIGHRNPLQAEVLRGLAPDESVVLHPGDRVADGARVRKSR